MGDGGGVWGHLPAGRQVGGRTLRRVRSSTLVRAAESVRRLDSDSFSARAPTDNIRARSGSGSKAQAD